MVSLSEFSKRIKKIAKEVEPGANRVQRLTALAIDQALVLATPVDEGRARSNWQVVVGRPATQEIEPYSPGKDLGVGEGANARAAIAQAQGTLNTAFKGEKKIYISNPVPWVTFLNEGSSSQAPANFVERAIAQGIRAISKVKII